MFIVIIVLLSSFLLITRSNEDSYSFLQHVKIGDDLFTSLDINGKLDSLNKATIGSNIENILPSNFNYTFKLECENKISQKGTFPQGSIIGSERLVVTDNLDFCIVRYWIWPK
ncbi:MAG: hypothetical protein AABW46_02150 [Nanoarchaeota archaeon]